MDNRWKFDFDLSRKVKNSCDAAIAIEQTSEPAATPNSVAALFGLIASLL